MRRSHIKNLATALFLALLSVPGHANKCPDYFVQQLVDAKILKEPNVASPKTGFFVPSSSSAAAVVGTFDALTGSLARATPNLLIGLFVPDAGSLSNLFFILLKLPDYAEPDDKADIEAARDAILYALRSATNADSIVRTEKKGGFKVSVSGGACDQCEVEGYFSIYKSGLKVSNYSGARTVYTNLSIYDKSKSSDYGEVARFYMPDIINVLQDRGYEVGYWDGKTKTFSVNGQECH